jgi:hypothetical protein
MLKIIEAKGTIYECGYAFGKEAAENIRYRLRMHFNEAVFKHNKSRLEDIYLTTEKSYPKITEELHGMAEGAGLDFWHLLYLNVPEITHLESGCTSIAIRNKKELRVFHNEDGISEERTADCFLVHYEPNKGPSFFAFTYAGEVPGGSYNWNEHHLFFSVNFLRPLKIQLRHRVPRTFIARSLIDSASVEDAVHSIKHGHDASGYHYYIGQKNKLYSLENFRCEISVREVTGTETHANHYTHPYFADKAPVGKHSRIRFERVSELLQVGEPPLKILADREYAPYCICTKKNEVRHTISTVEFAPHEKRVTIFEPHTLKKEKEFPL